MNVAALSRESVSEVRLASAPVIPFETWQQTMPRKAMQTLHTVANCAVKGVQDLPHRTAEHIVVKLCMLSKRSNYPIHAFNATYVADERAFEAGWCTHSSKTFMHAGTVQIRHGIAPCSTALGSVHKPQAAHCKI